MGFGGSCYDLCLGVSIGFLGADTGNLMPDSDRLLPLLLVVLGFGSKTREKYKYNVFKSKLICSDWVFE